MSLSITTTPSEAGSLYNAVHNPIIFTIQRQDLAIDHITIVGGFELNGNIYPSGLPDAKFTAIQVGDYIYSSNSTVKGTFEVIAKFSDHITVLLPSGYVAGTYTGGILNVVTELKNYYIEIQIGIKNTGTYVSLITTQWVPSNDGSVDVDVSTYLRPLLPLLNEYDYFTNINEKDENLSLIYTIKMREVWTDHTEAFGSENGDYYATNSAKQIGDLYGQNMAEFVTFNEDLDVKAKFVTGFKLPHYWTALPFDLPFIYGSNITGTITRNTTAKNINGTGSTVVGTALSNAGRYFLNRMLLSDITPSNYYLDVALATAGHAITEVKRVRIETDCTPQPVYLCWKSKNGGWDYWCFQFNQTLKRNVGDIRQYEKYITDFAAATARIKVASKTSVPSMVIGASNVPVDDVYYNEQYPGLTGLLESPEVLMLTNPLTWMNDTNPDGPFTPEGAKWVTVTVKPGTFKTLETRNSFSDIEIEITLPYLQIEKQ